ASGNGDGTVSLWEVANGKEVRRLEGHRVTVRLLVESADERTEVRRRIERHGGVRAVAFSPDGELIASGGGDRAEYKGEVRLWEGSTGKLLRGLDGHRSAVTAVAFSPDGRRLATLGGDWENVVRFWEPATGKKLGEVVGPQGWASFPAFSSIAFSP